MRGSIAALFNKAKEFSQPLLDEAGIAAAESGAAKMRAPDTDRHRAISEARELEQLEAAYSCLFGAHGGKSSAQIAVEHKSAADEIEEVLERASHISRPDDRTQRKIAKLRIALDDHRRKQGVAERLAAANVKQRAEFEADGRMARLLALRKARTERQATQLSDMDVVDAIAAL